MKKLNLPLTLLTLVAFLLPVIGGQMALLEHGRLTTSGETLGAIFGGAEAALLTHMLLGLLVVAALGLALLRRQIIQVPNTVVGALFFAFFGLLAASVGLSQFRMDSLVAWCQWAVYGIAFFTTVAVAGRGGARFLFAGLAAGGALVALRGIVEYQGMRAVDPSFRIFSGWINPNALAGMLILCLVASLALQVSEERVPSFLAGIAAVVIGLAFSLTGSRGGLLAGAVGVVALLVGLPLWKVPLARVARAGAAVAICAVLVFLLQAANRPQAGAPSGGAGMARVVATGSAESESSGFRRLLYQGAVQLAKEQPMGRGIGTYRFYSAQPGLTTNTRLTHNAVLQMAVESSPLSSVLFIGAIGAWLLVVFRSARKLPWESNVLRAGTVAAALATVAHGVVESNLSSFGIGMAFFMMLGLGVLLAADGVAPEYSPKAPRVIGLAVSLVVVLAGLFFGVAELRRSQVRGLAFAGEPAAIEQAKGLATMVPGDPYGYLLLAQITRGPENLEAMKIAAERMPDAPTLRRYATALRNNGQEAEAVEVLDRALEIDPKNLLVLRDKLNIQRGGSDLAAAIETAKRLVAVEDSTYFTVRSLSEVVPTETYEARRFLAEQTANPAEKMGLLRPALDGFREYAQLTVPAVIRFGASGASYAGESVPEAIAKMQSAREIAQELTALYRAAGDGAGVGAAEAALGEFDAALEGLSK